MDLSCGKHRDRCYLSYRYRSDINEEIESGVGKENNTMRGGRRYVKKIDQIRFESTR